MRRKLRRKQHLSEQSESGRRFPAGLLFTVLAVLVLLAVFGYDRHEQKEANDHAALAQEYTQAGKYADAVAEYKVALDNSRLSKKSRAAIAVRIAGIYFDHFEDYDRSLLYYTKGKSLWPASVQAEDVRKRIQMAQARTREGSGRISTGETTTSLISRVELLRSPSEDLQGEVVASFSGNQVHKGELERLLRRLPEREAQSIADDPDQLASFVRRSLDRALLYRAAMDADLHRDPEISERLYEYQRQLLGEQYEQQARDQATVIPASEVNDYYQKNRSKYVTTASMGLAMIKTESRDAATSAREALHSGTSFADVASTFSIHRESAALGGGVGTLRPGESMVPGMGSEPTIAEGLLGMNEGEITNIIEGPGGFYIYMVVRKSPQKVRTLDEVHGQIETFLRTEKQKRTAKITERLREQYKLQVNKTAMNSLLTSAAQSRISETSGSEGMATESLMLESMPVLSGGVGS